MRKSKSKKKFSLILGLVNDYDDIQETRIRTENRIRSYEQGVSPQEEKFVKEIILKRLVQIEKNIVKYLEDALEFEIIWTDWLKDIKGIGPILSAGLIGWIRDIKKFKTISKLWMYSGQAVDEDGKAMKRKRGKKLKYNPRMKVLCWKIGESFVKTKGGYRELYEQFRKEYDEKWETSEDCGSIGCKNKGKALKRKGGKVILRGCMKGHRYAAAKRKTVKVFLAHLFTKWYLLKKLKPRKVFIIGRGKHEHEIEIIKE